MCMTYGSGHNSLRTKDVTKHRQQQGFSLIEVSIVTAIMMLIAIIGMPAIQAYVI